MNEDRSAPPAEGDFIEQAFQDACTALALYCDRLATDGTPKDWELAGEKMDEVQAVINGVREERAERTYLECPVCKGRSGEDDYPYYCKECDGTGRVPPE